MTDPSEPADPADLLRFEPQHAREHAGDTQDPDSRQIIEAIPGWRICAA